MSEEEVLEKHFGADYWKIPKLYIPHIFNAMREYREAGKQSSPIGDVEQAAKDYFERESGNPAIELEVTHAFIAGSQWASKSSPIGDVEQAAKDYFERESGNPAIELEVTHAFIAGSQWASKSSPIGDVEQAAVNYVTERHNKQAGDVWYDEDESEKKAFIAGSQWASPSQQDHFKWVMDNKITDPPFPDKITFKDILDNMFKLSEFFTQQEIDSLVKAGEMYGNGCLRSFISTLHEADETPAHPTAVNGDEDRSGGQCDHCGGSGWDSYPNHSTTPSVCTWCEGTGKAAAPKADVKSKEEILESALETFEANLPEPIKEVLTDLAMETYPVRGFIRNAIEKVLAANQFKSQPQETK